MIMRSSSFTPYRPKSQSIATAKGAADFLHLHERLAALLPAAARMADLQKDCKETLPAMFETCSLSQFESGQLIILTPNAAIAAKLKQQLPKLQDALLKRGWQINSIRLKVQVKRTLEKPPATKPLKLPVQAVSALAELDRALENSPRNEALKAAIETMVRRHRGTK
jgi:hypothetical protein